MPQCLFSSSLGRPSSHFAQMANLLELVDTASSPRHHKVSLQDTFALLPPQLLQKLPPSHWPATQPQCHNLEPLHRCHRTSCRCGFASTPHLFKSCLEPRKQMRVARLQLCSHQCRNVTQSDSTTLGVCQDGWMNVTASHVQNQDNIAFLNDTSQR